MKLSRLAPAVCALLLLTILPACGDGGDTSGDGDTTGDGDGDTASGGSAAGGTGGTGTGGGAPTGGNDGAGGNGPIVDGSGTMAVDFNGTRVNFEVYQANDHGGSFGFIASSDSIDSDSVDGMDFQVKAPGIGTFDCSTDFVATVTIQALDTDGETSSFEALGAGDCTITVTEYGAVGAPVRGTLSGKVRAGGSGNIVPIENGVFDLIRGSDF